MPWPDIGSPTARSMLEETRTLAEKDPNCPNHVRATVQQEVAEICASETAPDGRRYEDLHNPTAYDEAKGIWEKAKQASGSPRPQARDLWLTIKTDLENFPSGM